jgi:2-polyprenyl-3-methyl-5-hydroxy-6-metoxy-1,4-benzoquinol methylase
MYNTTQLNPDTTFERHVYHRDQFAHFLRWTHVLKTVKIGMNILDFGCGSGNLAEVLYRNRYKAEKYVGLDIRNKTINSNIEKYNSVPWVSFQQQDLCGDLSLDSNWDIIASFEVIEHIGKHNARKFLSNIVQCMNKDTILLLSTPVFDEKVGAASNHIIDGEIGEFGFDELKHILEEFFIIENVWGTFASQRDYKIDMHDTLKELYTRAHEYFDSNILSNLMAPLISPEKARNCLWRCKLK